MGLHIQSLICAPEQPISFQYFFIISRYDAHHIIKKLQLQTSEELTAIAKTDETYISFNIKIPVGSYKKKSGDFVKMYHSLRFLDSFQFVSQSLENLAKGFRILSISGRVLPESLTIYFSKSHAKVFFPIVIWIVSKSSRNLYRSMAHCGRTLSLIKLI